MTHEQIKARCEIIKKKNGPRNKYAFMQYLRRQDEKIYTEKEIDIINQIEKRGFIYGSKC